MKRLIMIFVVSIVTTTLFAQHEHQGFYFSLAAGPAWGTVNGVDNFGNSIVVDGTGVEGDLQVGGTIIPGLILHGIITGKSVVSPVINGIRVPDDYSLRETMFGVGVTHYTAGNIFFTGNLGVGSFNFGNSSTSISTDNGFAFLLKAGKEWWVSNKIGLGAALTYGKTALTNTDGNITEKWKSNRFGVVVQFTID